VIVFSLRENAIAYIESKYGDEERRDMKWCECLPENLFVMDAPRVFKLSVEKNAL